MSVPWLVDLPQAREAPEHVRRGLRLLDPTAEVIYMGDGVWLVGTVRPNTVRRGIAERRLNTFVRAVSGGKRMSKRGIRKARAELLALQGFQPISEWHGDISGRVIEDFIRSRWLMEHTSDDELFRQMDAETDALKEQARKEMQDEGRARELCRYVNTRSSSDALTPKTTTPLRSGWTRHYLTSHT
jgi:hypothetical protein